MFLNKREKLQETRGLGPNTPLSAAQYQSSRNYPWKAEWTSVIGSRAFLDVMYANWYNFFPLRPTARVRSLRRTVGPGAHRDHHQHRCSTAAPIPAIRIRSATSRKSTPHSRTSRTAGKAATTSRWATTGSAIAATCSTISRSTSSTATPTARVNQVDLYNTPTSPTNDVVYNSAWISDTWKVNGRAHPEPWRPPGDATKTAGRSRSSRRTGIRCSPAGTTRSTVPSSRRARLRPGRWPRPPTSRRAPASPTT